MLCKRCMVVMKSGVAYEQKNNHDKKKLIRKKFKRCPKCNDKVYLNNMDFREVLIESSRSSRR